MNNIEEFTVPTEMVTAIINNDYSGLSEEDIEAIVLWRHDYNIGYMYMPDNFEQEFLPKNDVLGWIGAYCLTVKCQVLCE